MPKRRPNSTIYVASGGGLRELVDRRFDQGPWTVERVIPRSDAVDWMAQLHGEIDDLGWQASGISQLDAAENSGTLSIGISTDEPARRFDVIWERARGGSLRVRAGIATEDVSGDEVRSFVERVDARHHARRTNRAHRRAILTYEGLPWRGELWLQDDLRLGPPSRFPDALIGPQAVIVDAMCEGIGPRGVDASFDALMSSLRGILGFVLGLRLEPAQWRNDWVPEIEAGRIVDCAIRSVGYVELAAGPGLPKVGEAPPAKREDVDRPGLGRLGIWPDMTEEWVPGDVEELWNAFRSLPDAKRVQILRAARAYQVARSLSRDHRTASAAYLVVTCETLKPRGRSHDRQNIYDVVASLLGDEQADKLRRLTPRPQTVRSRQFHRGELEAGELLPRLMFDDFSDPSFDRMFDSLWEITRLCLIEWLRRGGH